jgi:hypothetical protein
MNKKLFVPGACIADLAPAISPGSRRRRTVAQGLANNTWIGDISGALTILVLIQYLELHHGLQHVGLDVHELDKVFDAGPPLDSDKAWIPDLPKGSDNYRFRWIRDTPIRLQIQRNEPCNLSTTNPLVINLAAARLTSSRRLTLACESKNTSKCTEKQPNHRKQLIQLTSGVPQPKNDVLFLTEMN